MTAVTAYVGLGANLGDPVLQLDRALDALTRIPQTRLGARSSYYRTGYYPSGPIGLVNQPDFVNAVCRIETGLSAVALLQALGSIEHEHGRTRDERDAPRTLDLDLLLYDTQVVGTPALTLPHPRMHERAFVLAPLHEIAPALEIPGRGTVAALLHASAGQRVQRLP